MRIRSNPKLIALASALLLTTALAGPAVAQDSEASPIPVVEELRASSEERQEAREERQAARAERREHRALERAVRRSERAAARTERAAERVEARSARKEAWGERKKRRAEAWAGLAEAWAERHGKRAEAWSERKDTRAGRKEHRAEAWAERKAVLAERKKVWAERMAAKRAELAPIDARYSEDAADDSGVVRTDLGIAEPGSAVGQELGLWHYRIPAGTELSPHTHPGWQLARITDGELEYTVVEGEGTLLRADGSSEAMGPGIYVLATGDGVVENPTLVHLGANRGDEAVTILTATLFDAGEDIATLVEVPATDPAEEG